MNDPREPKDDVALAPELLGTLRPRADDPLPKTRRLYLALYAAIDRGVLPYGERLPASRALAARLGLGRNTVIAVYEQLVAEGLLAAEGRRGTRVVYRRPAEARGASAPVDWPLSRRAARAGAASQTARSFVPGEPDAALFPQAEWRQALRRAARLPTEALGYRTGSERRLQEAIARHLAVRRALEVEPARIVVTSGTRQSLVLAAQLFADAGDVAWVESPGYPGAVDAFRSQGLALRAMRVDALGARPPSAVRARGPGDAAGRRTPRLVYLTPAFQYPTTVALAQSRRDALLALSREAGSVLFEDDYDSEFRDDSAPRPALAAQPNARVVHAGTFSKLLFPAVRVAWLVVPETHVDVAHRVLRGLGGGNHRVQQHVVAELLDSGTVARHLDRARAVYARRRRAFSEAVAASTELEAVGDTGGSLSQVVRLVHTRERRALERALGRAGIGATPLESLLWHRRPSSSCSALVVGLGSVGTLALTAAVARLDSVLRSVPDAPEDDDERTRAVRRR